MGTLHGALYAAGGGVIVYVIVAACSQSSVSQMASRMLDGGAQEPGNQASMMGAVGDAVAQPLEDCGACQGSALRVISAWNDSSRIHSGEVILPAAPRAPEGVMTRSSVKIADGPLMVGTIHSSEGQFVTVPADSSCAYDPASGSDLTEGLVTEIDYNYADHQWPREPGPSLTAPLAVLADQKLCAQQQGGSNPDGARPAVKIRYLAWRPYTQ